MGYCCVGIRISIKVVKSLRHSLFMQMLQIDVLSIEHQKISKHASAFSIELFICNFSETICRIRGVLAHVFACFIQHYKYMSF